jgi:hypothetical protein
MQLTNLPIYTSNLLSVRPPKSNSFQKNLP